jgi:hypothetical protein
LLYIDATFREEKFMKRIMFLLALAAFTAAPALSAPRHNTDNAPKTAQTAPAQTTPRPLEISVLTEWETTVAMLPHAAYSCLPDGAACKKPEDCCKNDCSILGKHTYYTCSPKK